MASVTDLSMPLASNEDDPNLSPEERRKAEGRKLLQKQKEAAEEADRKAAAEEERKKEEEKKKREKIAKSFGLSEEETQRYLGPGKDEEPVAASLPEPEAMAAKESRAIKEQPAMPTAPAVGGAEPRPAVTEPTTPPATGKEETAEDKRTDIEKARDEVTSLQNALGANKKPSREKLEKLLNSLDSIQPSGDIKDPTTRNFLQDKAEAYKAYKEKADRNEWLGLAQNLVNSLTQFASAQAATGTRFAGGGLPLPSTDYGARTEQAFREYRAQVGDIGEEQRLASAEQERVDRLRRESVAGQRATLQDRIAAERESIRQQESDAKEAGRDALTLFNAVQTNNRATQQNQVALDRALKQYQAKQDANTGKQLDSQIKYLEEEEKKLGNQLKAANVLASTKDKDYEKALSTWATTAGRDVDSVINEAAEAVRWTPKFKQTYIQETLAPKQAQTIEGTLKTIGEQLQQARAARGQVPGEAAVAAPRTTPTTPPPTTPTTAPSTTPAAPATVILRNPKNGKTKETVWDAKAQELVKSGQLELVR